MQIIQHLRTTYGKISPAQLISYEAEVTNLTYDPTTPVDLIFGKIDDLLMYGDFANCPFTATQAITKGYHILNNCGNIYNDYLRSWNRIPDNQKTWDRFKTHFRQAYNELEATNALNIGDLGFGAANIMNEVVDRMSTELLLRANHTSDHVPVQSDLIQELLDQNKELIRCLTDNKHKLQDSPRRNVPGPKQGQPGTPLPPRVSIVGPMVIVTITALSVATRRPDTRLTLVCRTKWEVAC